MDSKEQTDLVRRTYQYVALYNVLNKFALDPSNPMSTGGWNRMFKSTKLWDASVRAIARPNNDTLYQVAMLDLRAQPMILRIPSFDSVYVSLETSAYDHYCAIPFSTSLGDGDTPQTILFYSARTRGYAGKPVDGVDKVVELSGDFATAALRVMPHANEPERFQRILDQIGELELMTFAQFTGSAEPASIDETFPAYGTSDADVFGTNFLQVMQFVINHSTFDPGDELDQALLAALEPLGVFPGNPVDADRPSIDGAKLAAASGEVKAEQVRIFDDPARAAAALPHFFLPKGSAPLEYIVIQSVVGPIGQPATEALYIPVGTADGLAMTAQHDYTITMTAENLPPARAFWSVTLYDTANGFFIPNDQDKYSVGLNSGFALDGDGGIVIHIAANKPESPEDNWLPITRGDIGLSAMLRIYSPDLAKVRSWRPPSAVQVT